MVPTVRKSFRTLSDAPFGNALRKAAMAATAAKFNGNIDIMVNCAGIVGPTKLKINEVDVNDFDRVYAVNLRGSFNVTKAVLPYMNKNDYGQLHCSGSAWCMRERMWCGARRSVWSSVSFSDGLFSWKENPPWFALGAVSIDGCNTRRHAKAFVC